MRDPDQSYSLTNLEDAVEDAVQSDCTPEEIYEAIRTSLRRTLTYHRICVRTANEALRLVHGTHHKDKVISLHEKELDVTLTDWPDYTELPEKSFAEASESWRRIEDPNFIENERNNEENPMSYQEMIDAGYEMTGDGIWWPKDKEEETPDYNNPYVCAKIDELAGDNRN
jgi:hypothetical protein